MIENMSTQLTVFHCFAHCLLPGRAFASLYALLFLEKEAEIGGRVTAITNHVIKYCETVFERNDKNLFLSVKNAGEILNKLKSKCFLASSVSRYDFSTLYTTFYFITSSEFNAYQM